MAWLVVPYQLLRVLAVVAPFAALFVVVTALAASVVESRMLLGAIGLAAATLPGALLAAKLRGVFTRRRPSYTFVITTLNVLGAFGLVTGFADLVGTALRRHGDWFLGEARGAVARHARASISDSADVLESFDPHPALAPVVTIPERGAPPPVEVAAAASDGFHPLSGPDRALPRNHSTRFGAARPQPRPSECELGHCGVDLGHVIGQPVFAVHDGVVAKILRDPSGDLRAGRYVILHHRDGTIGTRYLHLDSVRHDLVVGTQVKGGELIGRLGRSGIYNSGPHLHFGMSFRDGGRDFYVDPEPYLRLWRVLTVEEALARAEIPSR